MTIQYGFFPNTIAGLSTDTKPTGVTVPPGAIFTETDTGATYSFDGTNWNRTPKMQAVSSFVTTNPSAVTSATAVAIGLSSGPGSSTIALATAVGATSVVVGSATSFFQGESVLLGGATANAEILVIKSIVSTTFTFTTPTVHTHPTSETIVGGYGLIQPSVSGKLKITIAGSLLAGSSASTVTVRPYIGSAITVAAPANAAAFDASAVAVGNVQTWVSLTGALTDGFACSIILGANPYATDTAPSGGAARTVGTPYYVDLGITSSTGTIQVIKPSVTIEEIA